MVSVCFSEDRNKVDNFYLEISKTCLLYSVHAISKIKTIIGTYFLQIMSNIMINNEIISV